MKNNNFFSLMLILILGASCASGPSMMAFSERMVGETESSTELRAYVGDIVFSKFDYTERFNGRITTSFKATGGTYKVNDVLYTRTLVNGGDGGCTNTMIYSGGSLLTYGMDVPLAQHCFYDSDGDGSLDKGYGQGVGDFKLNPQLPMPQWVQSAETTGTKKELIYQGRDGNTLRLRYREFYRDIVRPSYDQTVEYNLDEATEITFRGLGITIVEADNQYLLYTINSGTLQL